MIGGKLLVNQYVMILSVKPNCTSTEFQCDNGECIPDERRCDLLNHCQDGTDEDNCSKNKALI